MLLLILAAPGLFAQEEPPEEPPTEQKPPAPPIESGNDNYETPLYSRGDKTFTISLGILFPTYFSGSGVSPSIGLSVVGGTGCLSFNYFLGSNLFIGGELSGMFASTRGSNMYFMVPFGPRVGYQFLYKRFEFPITVMVGMAPQKKLDEGYFGLIIKPGAAAYWRFNPDWSFGLNAVWWWVPQWPKPVDGKRYNVYGNFTELTLSARYHF